MVKINSVTRVLIGLTTAIVPLTGHAQDVTLDTIVVEGSSYETEGTKRYTSDLISVGEKAAMDQRAVPQSTSVVTRQQIEDAGYSALETAVEDVPGLLVLNNDVGRSSLYSRGFEFDYLYYDGLPAPVSSIYGTQPDLAIADHVEVLKGPSGLFTATGSPAGSVNVRLKQANRTDPGGYVTGTVDQNGHGRIEADVGGALNAAGTLRGRVVGVYADGDGAVDKQTNGVRDVYGTIAWDISPDTTATFSLNAMKRDISPFNGLPTYADGSLLWIDGDATTGADWNTFDNETIDGIAAIEHRFANGMRAKFSLRQSRQTADFMYAYAGSVASVDNRLSRLAYLGRDWEQNSTALDAHVEVPFSIGQWTASAMVGVDHQKTKATTLTARGTITGNFDLDDWNVGSVAKPVANYSTRVRDEVETSGLYAQFRVSPVDALGLIGGARMSWYEGTSTNLVNRATDRLKKNGRITPFAGVTYDVTPDVTLYASYSEIFQPQNYVDARGRILAPLKGTQTEIGAKAQLFTGLNVSAALFDLRQSNRPQAVVGQNYYVAQETARARGVELQAAGEITDNLSISAGYTYTDTEYSKGVNEGETFSTVTPENIVKLSVNYDVTDGALSGWSFGGHWRVMSDFSSNGVEAPGYGVVDLSAAKVLDENTTLRVGIANALDKDYYARVGSTTVFNFRGEPRTLSLSLTRKF